MPRVPAHLGAELRADELVPRPHARGAYGWTDLRPEYDYRVQLDERVRYTWDDDTRDEVLARLLEEDRRAAAAAT